MTAFRWPEGRRCALSLSFDDGRASHAGRGREVLGAHGVRASFYVLMSGVRKDEAAWRRVIADGHELGNHTVEHPCSGNAPWARPHALEDYTLERMDAELAAASADIAAFAGVAPSSYAYCCGQKFVGRGEATRSYVPVVAKRFRVGRGFRDEWANDPGYVDLAQVAGIDGDGMSAARILAWVDEAAKNGSWVVIAAHDIGDPGHQTLAARELDAALTSLRSRPEVWIDTVGAVGGYVAESRLAAAPAR